MFYSTELLGRKSPLGQVWIAAHGKKLMRSKVAGVDVVQVCNKILQPEVPQALRLQGILMGGVIIIYSRQTHFLLEDCKDVMKKINTAGAADDSSAGTLLQKKRSKARSEAITMPEADDITDAQLDLPLFDSTFDLDAPLGSDVFLVRGTWDEGADDELGLLGDALLTDGRGRSRRHQLPPDPTPFHTNGNDVFDVFGQPETFEQVDGDLPPLPDMDEMPPAPDAASPGAAAPPPNTKRSSPEAELPPLQQTGDGEPQASPQAAQEQPEIMPGTPEQEDKAEQRQKKRRATAEQRRFNNLVVDRPDAMQVPSKVFREWTVERGDLLTDRPLRARHPGAAGGPAPALHGPPLGLGAAAAPLLGLFRSVTVPQKAPAPATPPPSPTAHAGAGTPPQLEPPDADELPLPDAAEPADMDLNGGADPAVGDLEVERLRAALNSPAAGRDMLCIGLTPSSNATAPGTGLGKRRRSRIAGPEPVPALSDRSTPRSRAGSQELDVEVAGPAPEDLLPTVHEDDLPELPDAQEDGGLSQFALAVDSGRGTGSQLTPSSSLSPNTLLMLQVLKQRFEGMEAATPGSALLSLDALAAGLSRMEAARLFYQICSSTSNRYLVARQEEPYGDITLMPGTLM